MYCHAHGSSGCRCLSCDDPPVGWFVDHAKALFCDDIVAARSADGARNNFGKELASCDNGPLLSFEDAVFGAKARSDIPALTAEVRRLWALLGEAASVFTHLVAIHRPIADDSGAQWCEVCSQEEEQPQPVGYWVPFPCPTVVPVLALLKKTAEPQDDYEKTTGHLITCLAVAGGGKDPDCPCTRQHQEEQT